MMLDETTLEAPDVPERIYRYGSNGFYLACALATLASYTFEGPLRFGLQLIGAESFLYLRDVFEVVCVGMIVASWLTGQAIATPLVLMVFALLAHTCIALVSLPQAFQALFGFKIYLPMLLGFAVAPILPQHRGALVRWSGVVLLATALGVGLSSVIDFPWIGVAYESAFGSTTVSRLWWDNGAQRLSGFARESFDASTLIVLSLVPLMASRISGLFKVIALGLTLYVILLTTQKTPLIALFATLLALFLGRAFEPKVANAYLAMLCALCLGVPAIALQLQIHMFAAPRVLRTFAERAVDMWPRAIALFDSPLQAIWGRGLGGIGVPQIYGEWSRVNAADNLMVYLLVSFGVIFLGYVAWFMYRLLRYLEQADRYMASCVRGWSAFWLASGITLNMIELSCASLVIGVVFGLVWSPVRVRRVSAEQPALGAPAFA